MAISACEPKVSKSTVNDISQSSASIQNASDSLKIDYGFDQLGCIVTIPDFQFDDPKFGDQTISDTYFEFETKLFILAQHTFPVARNNANIKTAKDPKKEFFIFVPSLWKYPETINKVKEIHAQYYPNSKLVYGTVSVSEYAKEIIGVNIP